MLRSATTKGVPIKEHTLTLTLLAYLIDRADHGQLTDLLRSCDLSPEDMDDLRRLPFADVLRVTDQQQSIFEVVVNRRVLRHSMMMQQQQATDDSDVLWFVRSGAPAILMMQLFGVSAIEFRSLRRNVGLDPRPGRPRRPDDDTVKKLCKHWISLSSSMGHAKRYRLLAEENPTLSIGSIYAALEGDQK